VRAGRAASSGVLVVASFRYVRRFDLPYTQQRAYDHGEQRNRNPCFRALELVEVKGLECWKHCELVVMSEGCVCRICCI